MKELKPICPPEHCSGCMACMNSCAHGAIEVHEDLLGFRYPGIASDRCTGCGLCESACPELNRPELKFPKECYAAIINQREELMTCASGGAATALGLAVISRGGAVCGCSGEDMNHVRHIIVDTPEGLDRLKGSKYVQSEVSPTILKEIRSMLLAGREVLFIGTGCQTAGVRTFLRKPFEGLTTVDLVCHGVPSQRMLSDAIALYPDIEPNSVRFRVKDPKPNGASAIRYGLSYRSAHTEQSIFIDWKKDPYMAAFIECIDFRRCCYDCRYAYSARQSDLTICDYWGLRRDSSLAGAPGVSAILVNTERGRKTLDAAASLMTLERRTVKEAVVGNGQLQCPSHMNPLRPLFERLYVEKGFKEAVKATAMRQLRRKALRALPARILRKLKHIIKI